MCDFYKSEYTVKQADEEWERSLDVPPSPYLVETEQEIGTLKYGYFEWLHGLPPMPAPNDLMQEAIEAFGIPPHLLGSDTNYTDKG